MTNKTRLLAVRKRLHSKKHWTQGASAREESGPCCSAYSLRARRWCLSAALTFEGVCELFANLHFTEPRHSNYVAEIIAFNDDPQTDHKDILRALDKAIKLCKT